MSKISKEVKEIKKIEKTKPVVNYMGGISYELNPLDTLKMVSASSVFGEPAYYRDGIKDGSAYLNKFVKPYAVLNFDRELSTSEVMVNAINDALEYDFKATLEWAIELRNDFYMRLNPQVIMVLAAIHPKRAEFTEKNPGLFAEINKKVMRRADEPASQLAFYLYTKGNKNGIPSILKRSWADRIAAMRAYEVSKYKNAEIGLIDTVRVCHAKSPIIDELMKTGTVKVTEEDKTWNQLRSEGKTWREIIDTVKIPHMALIRNLRGIFSEIDDEEICNKLMNQLKNGVLEGKQFPFRYYTALKSIERASHVNHLEKIKDTLQECIDIAIANMPKLKGKTACLSDNSGSAWGTFNSEYGTVTVADIDNLSSVLTCMNSDEGDVYVFGDRLKCKSIGKRDGALTQTSEVEKLGRDVGGGTENGIWLFFKKAIEEKIHYDNIFIYSDMQAGHGGLYGQGSNYVIDGESFKCKGDSWNAYIDVMKLINTYRAQVNPKANVFCVQTAGYTNVLIPEFTYRGAVLYGWTGKESTFANEIIKQWEDIEVKNKNKKQAE